MSIPRFTTDLAVIQKLSDLPNSTEGLTADQLKAKFDEAPLALQKWLNETLIPAIIAARIPFAATSEINADNVDAAIRAVHAQVKDASTGTIVNGSVTTEKLSPELLERIYGGRPYVSVNTPGAAQNPDADFPVGQIWLRPRFTVVNAATENWVTSGCSVATEENKITVTGNNTVATATATQAMTGIGQDGDRVYVLFNVQNKDSEITALTVSLNSGEEQDVSTGVFEATLVGGALTVQFSATWPSTSLAGGSFDVVNYAVVNVNQVLRQTTGAEDMTDWANYLTGLLPLDNYTSPEEVFIQTTSGSWWPLGKEVYPVERGGTGFDTIAPGELLMGGDNNTVDKLAATAVDDSVLTIFGGRPRWAAPGDEETSVLRVATGSYKGNGGSRTITLPVVPKMIHISNNSPVPGYDQGGYTSDKTCTLAQGCKDFAGYEYSVEGGTSYAYGYVTLNGKSLELTGPYFCNRSNVTYHWVAIY